MKNFIKNYKRPNKFVLAVCAFLVLAVLYKVTTGKDAVTFGSEKEITIVINR